MTPKFSLPVSPCVRLPRPKDVLRTVVKKPPRKSLAVAPGKPLAVSGHSGTPQTATATRLRSLGDCAVQGASQSTQRAKGGGLSGRESLVLQDKGSIEQQKQEPWWPRVADAVKAPSSFSWG